MSRGEHPIAMIAGPARHARRRLGWWAGGLLVGLVAASWAAERLVDWLWMGALGYRAVFWHILHLRPRAVRGGVASAYALLLAQRARRVATGGAHADGDGKAGGPHARPPRRSPRLRLALPALVAFVFALGFTGLWDDLVRFRDGGSFGVADPLLGLDVGFYVFRLPLLSGIQDTIWGWSQIVCLIAEVVGAVAAVVTFTLEQRSVAGARQRPVAA